MDKTVPSPEVTLAWARQPCAAGTSSDLAWGGGEDLSAEVCGHWLAQEVGMPSPRYLGVHSQDLVRGRFRLGVTTAAGPPWHPEQRGAGWGPRTHWPLPDLCLNVTKMLEQPICLLNPGIGREGY